MENETLTIPNFVMCIILSLGIVGPLITVGSYTDDLGKIGVIVGEVVGILEQPELKRPAESTAVPKDNSVTLTDVKFGYHDKEILHGVTMELKAGTVNAIVGPSGKRKINHCEADCFSMGCKQWKYKDWRHRHKRLSLTDFNRKNRIRCTGQLPFNESVRENIRQGNPNATDEQVIEVTKEWML